MKKVSVSEQILLTLVTICCAYFLGHVLIGLFDLLTFNGKDEITGFFSLATVSGGLILKEVKDIKPLPFTFTEDKTKGGKDAYCLIFEDKQKSEDFRDLATIAGLLTFPWYSKGNKEAGTIAIGILKTAHSSDFIKHYNKATFKTAKEMKVKVMADKAKEREERKATKQATKGKVVASTNAVSDKINGLKQAFADGILTEAEFKAEYKKLVLG
jgi:hypothetical protein